jgi:serine/threonine protein kinase
VPSAPQTLRLLAAELILGLLFLHENGIVHKDVKPGNVLISPTGHALITGFGAANVLPRAATATVPRLYGPIVKHPRGAITFNPPYAAPELFETTNDNLLEYDERVDFYSLGVLLYECATGTPPLGSEVEEIGCEGSVTSGVPEDLTDAAGKVSEMDIFSFRNFVKQVRIMVLTLLLKGCNNTLGCTAACS